VVHEQRPRVTLIGYRINNAVEWVFFPTNKNASVFTANGAPRVSPSPVVIKRNKSSNRLKVMLGAMLPSKMAAACVINFKGFQY
jgi:hypothetical protein